MRYHRIIVIEFLSNSIVDSTKRLFAGVSTDLDASALALLGNYRTALEDEIADLTQQAVQSSLATSQRLLSQLDFCIEDVAVAAASGFWQPVNGHVLAGFAEPGQFCQTRWDSLLCQAQFCEFKALCPTPIEAGPTNLCYPVGPVFGGQCWQCGQYIGMAEQQSSSGSVFIFPSCPGCGSAAGDAGFTTYLGPTFLDPLVIFVAQFLLAEVLCRSEHLLRFVIAAVAVILSRLRATVLHHAIAIAQRSFFTHHGAHPPRVQPLQASGLLPGRVFQFQAAG